jgi:hypothetical protein
MASELPKTVKAWFPARARHPHATGLFLMPPDRCLETWHQYHHLMADRVSWMVDQGPAHDLGDALDILERAGLLRDRPATKSEFLDQIRAGLLQERLVLLGVDLPTTGRFVAPARLMEVGLIEWASSLLENEPADEMPSPRRR